jgi:hypothetical protein
VEFAVLILRICLYATQFLPSHAHSGESISGSTLPEIRNACTEVGNRLAKVCVALNWKGSLVRVQHMLFVAIKSSCEGRTDQFWEGIGAASQAAQKVGIQSQTSDTNNNNDELEKEMQRRVFCSLYVLDRYMPHPPITRTSLTLSQTAICQDSLIASHSFPATPSLKCYLVCILRRTKISTLTPVHHSFSQSALCSSNWANSGGALDSGKIRSTTLRKLS